MRGLLIAPLRWRLLAVWLACSGAALQARELADYHVGEVAEADIATPVALDVPDPAATAALRAAKALQYPSIFRSLPQTTNAVAADFLAAFDGARTNFLADVAIEFHSTTVKEATIASADFGRLLTVYGVENKSFPVPDELAAEWARGGDGHAIREKLLATLLWAASRPVRPDAMPPGMSEGESVRLVPVADLDQKLSLETVEQAALIPAASLMTVSNAQALFRREFPAGQQLFARALARFIRPNCFPDAPFTQLTRGTAVYKVMVSDHFDAGDTLVRQGDVIDAKSHAALIALSEKLAADKVVADKLAKEKLAADKLAAEKLAAEKLAADKLAADKLAAEKLAADKLREEKSAVSASTRPITPPPAAAVGTLAPNSPPPSHTAPAPAVPSAVVRAPVPRPNLPHYWLIMTLIGISGASLIVAAWQFIREHKRTEAARPAAQPPLPLPLPAAVKDNLTPQVAQAVREAVQQELAMQRRELLIAQQAAANEIAALVQRLDELQMPMQERLHTYESRIQELEKELHLRHEENRELLRIKIDMITRQLAAERAASLIPPISA